MMKKFWDYVALSVTNLATQLADGANALAAYTRKHGDAVGFAITFNYTSDGDATYAIKLQESDDNSTWSDVAAANQSGDTGTFTQAQLAALSPTKTAQINYHGSKKYSRAHITTANITDNANTVYTRVTVLALELGMKRNTANM